jgi:hypothetical protein
LKILASAKGLKKYAIMVSPFFKAQPSEGADFPNRESIVIRRPADGFFRDLQSSAGIPLVKSGSLLASSFADPSATSTVLT